MTDIVDAGEMAHYGPPHLDLHCLQIQVCSIVIFIHLEMPYKEPLIISLKMHKGPFKVPYKGPLFIPLEMLYNMAFLKE